MLRTFPSKPSSKAGFTLLEMLFVMAIMAMTAAMIMPNIQRSLERNEEGRQQFHFRRLILDVRATAFREERGVVIVNSGEYSDDETLDPAPAEIKLDDGWSYQLSAPIHVSPGGVCDVASIEFFYQGRPRMTLESSPDCALRVPS